ncbi:peptidoglycan editing factor PgeF [Apibacter raozihei]|uniref:peptidoglycan editing factor PgeF n=1 Tax=Apibacter raozihei TaxID=2500547 RepID=UPI000FE2F656|nr:peptidoglycan editing factor PgeF [Apibacter raozihei]
MNTISDKSFYTYSSFSGYKSLIHFTTTLWGGVSSGNYSSFNFGISSGDEPNNIEKNKKILSDKLKISVDQIFIPRLTHSNKVAVIDKSFLLDKNAKSLEILKGVDALVTNQKGICIGITTADCVPVLLYDPVNKTLGTVHAGWRGTVSNIAGETVKLMVEKFNCKPENILAAIGPSISIEHFEVGSEVVEEFVSANFNLSIISKINKESEKHHIDLWKANRFLLLEAGLLDSHIEISGICTYKDSERFFSARRQTLNSGRMLTGGVLL